tara:strand:+ start:65 stop:472 length:408 start_codon:yes stop_codon:yes gene_type:complete
MRKIQILFLMSGLLIFSSCSKHIYVNYQTESANTGKVVLKPSKPTDKTYVTINDNLIVDRKNVKSVTINNVPNGDYNIHYTSDNSWYKDKLDAKIPLKMENGKETTKLVEVPPYSTGYWIYMSAAAILPWVLFSL